MTRHADVISVHRIGRRSLAAIVFPIIMLILGMSAAATIASLQNRADASRQAQVHVASFRLSLQSLLNAAFSASPQSGGSPVAAAALISADEAAISQNVLQLAMTAPPHTLTDVQPELSSLYHVVSDIYRIGAFGGGYNGPKHALIDRLQSTSHIDATRMDAQLTSAATAYAGRAARAKEWASDGATIVIFSLLVAFAFFYLRSVRARRAAEVLGAENTQLLIQTRHDANTDALTGLPNRRALREDLAARLDSEAAGLTLGLFDLDGFKAYNDTFGHVAGDALLQRLGAKLAGAFRADAKAYRIGGDEFCVLAAMGGEQLAAIGVKALSESGAGWVIGSSAGTVSVGEESDSAEDALDIADQRMYSDKAARKGLRGQGHRDQADMEFSDRAARVERLAERTAWALGLDGQTVALVRAAASMYNVGLRSIPSSIVDRPGALDHAEWAFVRCHPIVGERMVATETVAEAASLVRSTQERSDGTGYPDGLRGEEIPLGSRIIAVCSAFVAMTTSRSYAPAMTVNEAMLELARNTRAQFDEDVVAAFNESVLKELVI